MVHDSLTITIKKATELYVVGGVAFDPDFNKHVFWYAVRRYPAMSRGMQRETGTKSITEYIQKFRPSWEGGEPPEEYEEFYKKIPSAFQEGSPKQIEHAQPGKIGPSMVLIGPTKIDYDIEATGDPAVDVPIVEQIIRQIRELIWQFPVEGTFTSTTGLQSDRLLQFINTNLKKAFKTMRLSKFAKEQRLRVLPETVRYVDVATGTIFNSESAVQQAIGQYHEEQELELELEPMLAAASKGGLGMYVGELLKIADLLDESGDQASADEITSIVEQIVDNTKKTAWVGRVIGTLTKVANSLDEKGATEEAQLADSILQSLQAEPQTLEPQIATEPVPASNTLQTIEVTDEQDTQPAEIAEATKVEAPVEKVETPFSKLDNNPSEVKIDETEANNPAYDAVSVDDLKGMISNLKWRHSQGSERQALEETLKRAEKAQEYFEAYKEWLEFAHSALGDRPIRLKIE